MAALLLREALETPERTAALVSPDQKLARRVAAKLARWGVTADSSAGTALSGLPMCSAYDASMPTGTLRICWISRKSMISSTKRRCSTSSRSAGP